MEREANAVERTVSSSMFEGSRHVPVLLQEALALVNPKPGDFFIDGTLGGGGHANILRARIAPGGKLLAIDLDDDAIARYRVRFGKRGGVILVRGNYADLPAILRHERLGRADGLLLDLGFSSDQLGGSGLPTGQAGRGFSFNADEPLRMTYDRNAPPLATLLRNVREDELVRILREYGGERYARPIARAIRERERRGPILTTGELADVVQRAVPIMYERGPAKHRRGTSRINPATRTFQALRIYANDELGNLERLLGLLHEILAPGGRVAIITFHSLEDKLVKDRFRELARRGELKLLTKKPIVPTADEVRRNPRSRSAKLRGAVVT